MDYTLFSTFFGNTHVSENDCLNYHEIYLYTCHNLFTYIHLFHWNTLFFFSTYIFWKYTQIETEEKLLDEFDDVDPHEKLFMKMWNRHVRKCKFSKMIV